MGSGATKEAKGSEEVAPTKTGNRVVWKRRDYDAVESELAELAGRPLRNFMQEDLLISNTLLDAYRKGEKQPSKHPTKTGVAFENVREAHCKMHSQEYEKRPGKRHDGWNPSDWLEKEEAEAARALRRDPARLGYGVARKQPTRKPINEHMGYTGSWGRTLDEEDECRKPARRRLEMQDEEEKRPERPGTAEGSRCRKKKDRDKDRRPSSASASIGRTQTSQSRHSQIAQQIKHLSRREKQQLVQEMMRLREFEKTVGAVH